MFSKWFKKSEEEKKQISRPFSRGEEVPGIPGSLFVGYMPVNATQIGTKGHPFFAFDKSDFDSMCFLFDELRKARRF